MKAQSFALLLFASSLAFAQFEDERPSKLDEDVNRPVGAIQIAGADLGMQLGDVVVAINGQKVDAMEGVARLQNDDARIREVTVLRNGKRLTLRRKARVE